MLRPRPVRRLAGVMVEDDLLDVRVERDGLELAEPAGAWSVSTTISRRIASSSSRAASTSAELVRVQAVELAHVAVQRAGEADDGARVEPARGEHRRERVEVGVPVGRDDRLGPHAAHSASAREKAAQFRHPHGTDTCAHALYARLGEEAGRTVPRPGRRLSRPARSPRSRRARPTAAPRPRPSRAPAAGRRRAARRPRSSPAKSPRSARKTVVLTSRSSPLPAASRIARRFAKTCSVCSAIESPTSSAWLGLAAPSWPETKTRPPALIACEYGAPWNGAGAASVRTTVLLCHHSSFRRWCGRRCASATPSALKIASSTCCGFVALDQADVQRQAGALGELVAGSVATMSRPRARRRARRERSTFETTSGRPDASTRRARAPRRPARPPSRAPARPRPAQSAARAPRRARAPPPRPPPPASPGATSSARSNDAYCASSAEQVVEHGDARSRRSRAPRPASVDARARAARVRAQLRSRRARSARRARAGARRSARSRGRSARCCRSSTSPRRRGPRCSIAMPARMSGLSSRCAVELRGPGDDDAVRVAEDDPRAHPDELVDEEQAALEHLLEDQHRAARLRRDGDRDRGQVGRERGPRRRPRSSGSGRRGRPGSRAPGPAGTRTRRVRRPRRGRRAARTRAGSRRGRPARRRRS